MSTFERFTRVVLAPSVASLAAPTVAEITAGVDLTPHMPKSGLAITRSTGTVERTPWTGSLAVEAPARYGVAVELTGYRDADTFWDAVATFRQQRFLIVRRELAYDTAFTAGQVVEALEVRVGKRNTAASAANTRPTFTVPLFVLADEDEAVVA